MNATPPKSGLKVRSIGVRQMESNPLITVVTITRNDAIGLRRTLDSIFGQTYTRIQSIVIDGASKDKTDEVLKPWATKLSVVLSEPDNGIYDAMNKGRSLATGDYLIFMNSGDTFASLTALEQAVLGMSTNARLYFGRAEVLGPHTHWLTPPLELSRDRIDHWLTTHTPNHQATFYPRKFYQQQAIDTYFRIAADTDYTRRAMRMLETPVFVETTICIFRLGGISSRPKSLHTALSHAKERAIISSRYLPYGFVRALAAFPSMVFKFLLARALGGRFFEYWARIRKRR